MEPQLPPRPPQPADSRSIRMSRFRKTVDKTVPAIDPTTTANLTAAEAAAELEQRAQDRAEAVREGRGKLRERFHAAAEKIAQGTTPDAPIKLPARVPTPPPATAAHSDWDDDDRG